MTIRIRQVSSTQAQAPRVSAVVDGEKVTWRARKASGPNRPAYTGWICSEHGTKSCDHVADLEDLLADEILDRMAAWERRRAS